ncbi:MAG: hypothetical protein K8R68_10415, partial [Bacteroidales bacterium]|nr:hypothetical protein [Bacteroidales bacterium]
LMAMLAENDCYLKAYLMLKPHYSLSEEEGIIEAVNGVKELHEFSKEFNVETSIHINPTYIAKDCSLTDDMVKFGFQPPELSSVIEVIKVASELKMTIYAGLDDEGMAIQGGTFRYTGLDKEKAVKAILSFNMHQDFERMIKEAEYSK